MGRVMVGQQHDDEFYRVVFRMVEFNRFVQGDDAHAGPGQFRRQQMGKGNALVNDCITGNFGLANMGQNMTQDYDFLKTYFNKEYIDGLNMARYENPEVEALFSEGASTTDKDARMAAYTKVEEITKEDCLYVPLFYMKNTVAWNKNLNYSPDVIGTYYKNVSWK